ncbi:hypothetical protein HDU88_009018 [Geranomyces variabilis]|nr:hypothetical protein HDU88_009018 [Geranomyces variabilis]
MPYYSLFLAEAPDVRIGAWQVARPPTAHQLREWVVIVFPQVAALPTDRTAAAAQLFDRHTHAPFSPADPMPNQHCDFYIKLSSAELGERSRGVIPSSATTTPSASGQSTPVEPRDLKNDRATFQPLLKQLTMIRDGGCIVTGNPFPSSLQCSHIIPPAIANDWFNARPASLRSLTPTVARKTGATDYTAGYDVRNALTLTQVLHSGFDAYKWGIITEANQLRTFNFTMPPSDLTDGPIRIPARGVFPGAETYYQDQFPDPALFRFHFEECVRRNFRAEGEGSAKPKYPEVGATDPVGAGDETSDVGEGDWSSMDMSTVASQKIWRGMLKQVASTDTIIHADDLEMVE